MSGVGGYVPVPLDLEWFCSVEVELGGVWIDGLVWASLPRRATAPEVALLSTLLAVLAEIHHDKWSLVYDTCTTELGSFEVMAFPCLGDLLDSRKDLGPGKPDSIPVQNTPLLIHLCRTVRTVDTA